MRPGRRSDGIAEDRAGDTEGGQESSEKAPTIVCEGDYVKTGHADFCLPQAFQTLRLHGAADLQKDGNWSVLCRMGPEQKKMLQSHFQVLDELSPVLRSHCLQSCLARFLP